jgi:hypothetical protein
MKIMITGNLAQNAPIDSSQNAPLALLGQWNCYANRVKRRYTRAQNVQALAVDRYHMNGYGTTYHDLISNGLACNKKQAQNTLKRCLQNNIIFTIEQHKPQHYYPVCLRSEVLRHNLSKNAPVEVTGVGRFNTASCFSTISSNSGGYEDALISKNNSDNINTSSAKELIVVQSLEHYVLPVLPSTPLHIHKMQFKLKIASEYYREIAGPFDRDNKSKGHEEIIGGALVTYRFYLNGTIMVFTQSSNNAFKLQDEADHSRLIAFFGQVRDRLVNLLADTHERIVPDLMEWELTQCDINKDVRVSDWLQFTGLKIQVKHLDHLFRIYIKSMGEKTVCRIEESLTCNISKNNKSSAIETVNNIFNPVEKVQKQIEEVGKKVDLMLSIIGNDKYNNNEENPNSGIKKGGARIQ